MRREKKFTLNLCVFAQLSGLNPLQERNLFIKIKRHHSPRELNYPVTHYTELSSINQP